MTKLFPSSKAKRLTLQGLLAASVVGLGVAGVMTQIDASSPAVAAQAEVEIKAEAVDPWVYDRIQTIRQELALTNADMAAMGMGLEDSKAVLTGLKTWVERNRKELEAKGLEQQKAERELSLVQRSVRVGPRDETVMRRLPDLEQALTTTTKAKRTLHNSGGEAIEGQLTASQRTMWKTAKANADAGVPSRYRYVANLEANQIEKIRESLGQRSNDKSRSRFAEADLQLYGSQRQAITTAETNQTSNMEAVQLAEEAALPQLQLPLNEQSVPDGVETERPG